MNAYELYDYLRFQRSIFTKVIVNVFDHAGTEFYITETDKHNVFKIEPLSDYLSEAFYVKERYNNLSYFPDIVFPVRFANEPR